MAETMQLCWMKSIWRWKMLGYPVEAEMNPP
jgi:hypothetical protein